MTNERTPDVEIYVLGAALPEAVAFLETALDDVRFRHRGKARHVRLTAHYAGHEIPVVISENIADGFTSIWINSGQGPWPNDEACAEAAWAHFSKPVRFNRQGWLKQGDEDLWWQRDENGTHTLNWPSPV